MATVLLLESAEKVLEFDSHITIWTVTLAFNHDSCFTPAESRKCPWIVSHRAVWNLKLAFSHLYEMLHVLYLCPTCVCLYLQYRDKLVELEPFNISVDKSTVSTGQCGFDPMTSPGVSIPYFIYIDIYAPKVWVHRDSCTCVAVRTLHLEHCHTCSGFAWHLETVEKPGIYFGSFNPGNRP